MFCSKDIILNGYGFKLIVFNGDYLDYDCCNDILSNDFVLKTIEPNDFSFKDI